MRTVMRMETFSHKKSQRLPADLQGADLPLHVRAEPGKHQLFVDPPDQLWPQLLLDAPKA
jgi:hypothetical protein